ncbi:hypothetical protein C1645_825780 [Glomus cerebriforme]|uniref:Uncharacterized protein n=1 Tax=Glomus cerebriforme TaxID=658196 RepID=A0A397SRQ5_9GLOM|nr:hypothetical protein C1645_825780 [Glomus cerebriforme]
MKNIYNPSTGKLRDIPNIEKTIEFLKNNSTKYPRKLYIGPTERDLISWSTRDPNNNDGQQTAVQTIVAVASSESSGSPTFDELAAYNNVEFIDLTNMSYSTIIDDEQDNITMDEHELLNPTMYKLTVNINNNPENVDLSLIDVYDSMQYSTFSINPQNLKKLSKKVWYDELVNKRIYYKRQNMTRYEPFYLTYGRNAIIPIELTLSSYPVEEIKDNNFKELYLTDYIN